MDERAYEMMKRRVEATTRPKQELLTYYLIASLPALIAFPIVFIPLCFRYYTLRYRFDEEGVSVGHGVLFRREMHLTFSRMQDIHLSQNLLERWLGIGTVTVQTAGQGEGGNMRIVGVSSYEAIRDYLYARMRGVRGESTVGAANAGLGAGPKTAALLTEIRDALRSAAQALGEGPR